MLRFVPFLLGLALSIYTVVDCIQTEESRVRGLPKIVWVFVILLFPFAGAIAWFLAGRPLRAGGPPPPSSPRWQDDSRGGRRPAGPPKGPDDDPDFLKGL